MNDLITTGGAAVTMTSLELVQFINNQREAGAAELAHSDFLKKVPQVLGACAGNFSSTYQVPGPNGGTRNSPCYKFPKREACLMAMSYSYDLQAKVFDKMTALEQQVAKPAFVLPDFTNPAVAARAWADQVEQQQVLAIELGKAIATKALIGSRREATAMATASAAKREVAKLMDRLGFNARHATVKAVEKATGKKFAWLALKKWCAVNQVAADDVPDPLYGSVKSWPADAWGEIYGVDLQELFSSEVPA